jgi:nicotinamide-nucleotide adenylyltransferase
MDKIALYIERFQPFHLGNLDAVNQIIADGVTRIIIGVSSSQEEFTRLNPFSFNERKEMISRLFHKLKINFEIHAIPDFVNNQDWVDYIQEQLPVFDYVYSGSLYVQNCFKEGAINRRFKALIINIDIKSTVVQNDIENRIDDWLNLVPNEVKNYILEINGMERMHNICDSINNTQHVQNKRISKILVVEKTTRFEYLQRKNELENLDSEKYKTIYNFDQEHSFVRKKLLQILSSFKLDFQIVKEKYICNVDLNQFELIISLGGDGTFLDVAKKVKNQIIMGINSEPGQSVGHMTRFNLQNLLPTLENMQLGLYNFELWDRLSVSINGVSLPFLALNEILVAKLNLYQTSKLQISLDTLQGNCFGNGILVSTKMGSTAFYKSAGGAPFDSPNFAYTMILPFQISGNIQQNGILLPNSKLKITPKRDNHYVIFDCDENRKVLLNDEDEVEIQKLDNNFLRVLVC